MIRLTTYTAVLVGFVVMALFMVAYFLVGQEIPKQIANIALLGVAVTIAVGWFPAAKKAIQEGILSGRARLIVTIWLSWSALLVHRTYVIINDSLGKPDWLVEGPGSIIVAVLILFSGWYAVIAPITDPEVSSREKVWDRMAIALGFAVSGIALVIYLSTLV